MSTILGDTVSLESQARQIADWNSTRFLIQPMFVSISYSNSRWSGRRRRWQWNLKGSG